MLIKSIYVIQFITISYMFASKYKPVGFSNFLDFVPNNWIGLFSLTIIEIP